MKGPDLSHCPICRRIAVTAEVIDKKDFGAEQNLGIKCPYCGVALISWTRWKGFPLISNEKRFALSRISRLNTIRHPDNPILIEKSEDIDALTQGIRVPKNALEQLRSLIECIAELAPNLGQYSTPLSKEAWAAITMLSNEDAFRQVLFFAFSERHLIEGYANQIESLRLTLPGWEYLGIQSTINPKKQAFVAMWFHDDMNSIWNEVYKPVLEELGWDAFRVDKAHFLNRIDDEIIQQIDKSGVLIADATGERQGVYFEAGYAMGQGIPVIWTCNKSWQTMLPKHEIILPESTLAPESSPTTWAARLHFDTRQYPHILWDNVEDLKEQLKNRLLALKLYHEK